MALDTEALAKQLMGKAEQANLGPELQKLIGALATPQGKTVADAIMQDGGKLLKKAAEDAKSGSTEAAKKLIASVASTHAGAEMLSKIISTLERQG